ncbi:TonB-dependent receptor [Nevskia sp.]|uniref:TonB-dependent receptor family protein n=1 Tax=Nevskia sp. TaxID=1929292 RepID=UPI0025E5A37A|nr:TonB-dependent receptor [Nevskia sp.]
MSASSIRRAAALLFIGPIATSLPALAVDAVPEDKAATPAAVEVATAPVTVLNEVKVQGDKGGSLTAPDVDAARDEINKRPGGVVLVGSEQFEDRYAVSFKDTLRDAPGVFAQARYGEEVRLSIRGSGLGNNAHLRGIYLLQDGIPVSRADGFGDFQEIDPLTTRYLEVYKGGNGLRYGGATLGGAINAVTPTGRTADQTWLVRLEGGSYDTFRQNISYAQDYGRVDVFAAVTNARAGGFRQHQQTDNQRINANVGYRISDDVETRFYVGFNEIDQEIPGAVSLTNALNNPRGVPPTSFTFDIKRDPTTFRLLNKTSVRLGDSQLDVGAYFWDRRLYHPLTGVIVDQTGIFYGAFAQWNGTGTIFGLANEVTLGTNVQRQDNDARVFQNVGGGRRGARTSDAAEGGTLFDFYGEDRLTVASGLQAIAGLQGLVSTRDYDDRINPRESAKRTYKAVNPKLGLLYSFDEHTQVFGNVSYSFEAPNYGALNQTTPVGANGFVPLDGQRAVTGEIGSRGEWTRVAWNISYYYSLVDKELLQQATSPTTAIQFNADETVHQGLEAGLALRLFSGAISAGDKLVFQQNYAYNDLTFDNDATYGRNRLAGAPKHYYQAQLRYDHPAGFFIEPGLEAANNIVVDYANSQRSPGYTIWNVSSGLTLPRGFSLFFDARNLLDRRYVGSVSTTTNFQTVANRNLFVPGEGRQFFGGVRWAFG